MVQEAKFELQLVHESNKCAEREATQGITNHIEYLIKLHDADGVEVKYHITDYYNSIGEIIDTRIWKIASKALNDLFVENDSRLGKKILTFITNEHPYRGDVLEAMFVAGREDRLKKIDNELNSFMRINTDNPDDGSYRGR
jgi:hypothetical protein